ncbi:hypothetical protein CONPUDRAFT_89523 [Coniophora puteana RWD-64-598 SS2]|uniref:Uncharacterized protein n=1 Tax=Coniophora puteana (strain RWD-64-598) TaxID=741705 RepID=A0A5M3MSK3_CONPW|nr:uncharacterized protein CONPUDRAFT_89523 [Coniophora puteana RWD-64-598 SS2]EIW82076.1 hypothetical protein CONPUDRAFT_89523 [Coniophora puteana RWD-64-598 SS2]
MATVSNHTSDRDGDREPRKSENRFVAFFRSRSRSRTRPKSAQASERESPRTADSKENTHLRHSSLQQHTPTCVEGDLSNPPTSYHKNSIRSQSRPISSTTTATHSTLGPLPSDTQRGKGYARYSHQGGQFGSQRSNQSDIPESCESHSHPSSRPETPASARKKRGLQALFGIGLSRTSTANSSTEVSTPSKRDVSSSSNSSRRRSFILRQQSQKDSEDKDKLSPKSHIVPSSPLPLSASRRLSSGSTPHGNGHGTIPHDSAVDLRENGTIRHPDKNRKHHSISNYAQLKDESDERHRMKADSQLQSRSDHQPTSAAKEGRQRRSPPHHLVPPIPPSDQVVSPSIPKIIQTPPTPRRPGNSSHLDERRKGKDIVKYVGDDPDQLSSPGRNTWIKDLFGDRLKAGNNAAAYSSSSTVVGPPKNMGGCSRRAQHGSFDFERPVSGTSATFNKGDATAARGRHVAADGLERTSSSSSSHAGTSRTRHNRSTPPRGAPTLSPGHARYTGGENSAPSMSTTSVNTKSTGKGVNATGSSNTTKGKSSSWGRAAGRRAQRTSHGAFAFEPAVSMPNSPTQPHTQLRVPTPASSPSSLKSDFGVIPTPDEMSPPYYHANPSPHRREGHNEDPSPYAANARGRSQNKRHGRSLDLGLGLSWAPTKVRQEAIMPGLSMAKQRNGSAPGEDVSKVFKRVLSESGFASFKNYVHSFDAHAIPLEGPSGLIARVDKLLINAGVGDKERRVLLNDFARFARSHAESAG